ncbi:hypothetical protein AB0I84_42640 [Streptomyces spectabilis]|uniref:hypothetical protein n=1 Tax=Streptomyces spectabilis TaxID=68270 RepID=UPI0033F581C9
MRRATDSVARNAHVRKESSTKAPPRPTKHGQLPTGATPSLSGYKTIGGADVPYTADDARTRTSYPGGTIETITRDKANRPERIKTFSPRGTLVDLAYDYAYTSGTTPKDGVRIRTETDAAAGLKRAYAYDSAGRLQGHDGQRQLAVLL